MIVRGGKRGIAEMKIGFWWEVVNPQREKETMRRRRWENQVMDGGYELRTKKKDKWEKQTSK